MRLILVLLFLILFFIISIPLFIIEYIIGKFSHRAKVASSQKIVVWAFRVILFISGVKYTAIGIDNVPKDEAVLYVANHRSYFDILVSYVTVPTLTGFIAKKEIRKVPFLRTWMEFLQCLFLDRNDVRQGMKVILQAIEQVKNGYSIFISPEGTRSPGNEMLPFKAGSFKIAEKSGCAIIPVSISNTEAIFENQQPWIRKAHVVIEYGKPIYPKTLEKAQLKSLSTYVQGIIKDTLDKNDSLVKY
ncbi:MAG: 1-acyl-sn-glycerol-3-phosphate acyltransferase [Clostridiales bacterium]|nr:1-acyl-sn-glycerol-3-phosphate acyltransferase [Clostridiales bacterium]